MKRDVTDYLSLSMETNLLISSIFEDFPKIKVPFSDLIFLENLASLIR